MKTEYQKEWEFIKNEIFGEEKPNITIDGMHLFKRDFLMYLEVILEQEYKFEFYQDLKKLYLRMPKFKDGEQITEWKR
jgi:hypothetical protein